MPNYMEEAFAPAEAAHKAKVIRDTWGHLFPDKEHYTGQIRLAKSVYDSHGAIILNESDSLPQNSPWWFDAINEFAGEAMDDMLYGEVAEFDVEVNIVTVMEDLEDWEIEEYKEADLEPKTWKEIQIVPIAARVLVDGDEE